MESAATTLVGNLGQLLGDEYRLLRGVGSDVAELRNDLATMNALLHMESEVDEGAVDRFVREWMKQLRELAYDAEDCVNHYKLRIKCRSEGGMRAWLKHMFETLFPRHHLAGEIRALRARAIAIGERHARYCVNRDAMRGFPSPSAAPVLASSVYAHALRPAIDGRPERHQPIGIDGQVDTLATRLKAGADGEHQLKVFSIVGFGGLGKTTLAMEVCRRLEPEFPCQAMVAVSQAFEPGRDVMALLKRLLQQLVKPKMENQKGVKEEEALGKIDGLDANELVDKLKEIVKDKRYLVVIDDVWTIRAWEAIQSVLPENKCDSRIIVTTRIESVANACSPASVGGHFIHHMEALKLEYSKKLFLIKAFGAMDADYPEELEDVISDILRKCAGLPLAIVSLASVLAGFGSSGCKDKWVKICKSIGSQMESKPTLEGMKHIVTLSYNHLPYELKGCMMYLSIFPEDYEVNKDRLLCRWIAEGLIPEKRGLNLMDVAESYLVELVNRNMVEVRSCADVYWKAEACRVHDMLLEVLISKALEYNFVSLLGGQQYATISYGRCRRLSIQEGGDETGSSRSRQQNVVVVEQQPKTRTRRKMEAAQRSIIEGMDVTHVRSLSIFQHRGQKLLDQLDKFALLSVLDLEGCEDVTNNHMRHICRLYLLRFLSLRGTDISQVPPEVRKLEHLQTFDLWESNVIELPETVTKLGKLECLHLRNRINWKFMWSLPRGLKNMRALRELGMVILGNDVQVAQDMGELDNLQDLKLFLNTEKISGNGDVVQELGKSLCKLYSLRRLIIEDHGYYGGCYDYYRGSFILDFLHDLSSPPRLLRFLKLSGVIKSIPTWVGSLTYLVEFRLCWGQLVDDQLFGTLSNLPNLKCIQLEWDCYKDANLIARTTHNFPSLTKLRVICGAANPKVFQFEAGSMAKLETLEINFSKNRERSIVGIEHLSQLREVKLTGAKDNTALHRALEQLEADISRRRTESGSKQFHVSVQYW